MRRKLFTYGVSGLLVTVMLVTGCQEQDAGKSSDETDEHRTRVEITTAERGSISTSLSLTGTLAPFLEVRITSKIPGRVEEVHVEEGDRVKAGDILIQLEQEELLLGVKQADAALVTAEAGLAKVKAGTRKEQIAQLEAAVAQAKANLDICTINLQRMSNLLKGKSIPKTKYDAAKSQYDVACAQHDGAKAQLEMAKTGPTKEDVAIAEARVGQAKAAVASAKRQLENSTIRSPISGIITKKCVEAGEVVSPPMMPGMPLLETVKLDMLKTKVNISEKRLGQIRLGQEADITADGLPGNTFSGRISKIAPVVDPQSRTFEVEINIPNPDLKLKPGMFARVRILLEKRSNVLLLPAEAVLDKGKDKVVFVAQDNVAQERAVTVGLNDGTCVEILSGAKEGESVIVRGNLGLESGTRIFLQREKQ